MSFLSEYLERRRATLDAQIAKQEDEQSSPEALLEALNANTGNTADLIGKQSAEAKTQSKAVVGGLENIASVIASSKPEPSKIDVSIERASELEQTSTVVTNKALASIADSLKELVASNKLVEKHLRPDLNPTDDTYQKRKDAAAEVAGKGKGKEVKPKGPPSAGLGGLLVDLAYDYFTKKPSTPTSTPTGKPTPTGTGTTPPGTRTRTRGGTTRTIGAIGNVPPSTIPTEPVRGRVGTFLSSTRQTLGNIGTKVSETATRLAPKMQTFAGRAWDATKGAASKVGTATFEAVERTAPKVSEALSKGVSKSAEYAARAKDAITPVAEKALESTKSAATTVADKGSKALSWVKQTGTDLIGKAKGAGAGAAEGAGGAATGVAEGGGKGFMSSAKSVLGTAGKWVGRLAAPVAVGLSAKEAYDTEQDESLTRDQKNVKHGGTGGGLAGGFAGAAAGASMGAAMGTVVPGIGNLIGGIGGGIIGGIGGYFGGSKLGEVGVEGYQALRGPKDPALASDEQQKALDKTVIAGTLGAATPAVVSSLTPSVSTATKAASVVGNATSTHTQTPEAVKTALGASIAMAISPIAKDSQEALNTKLVPALNETGKSVSDGATTIQKSNETLAASFTKTLSDWSDKFTDLLGGVRNAASSAWAGAKNAASATASAASDIGKGITGGVSEGYKTGGVMGALKGGIAGGRQAGSAVSADWAKDMSVSKGIAVGKYNDAERAAMDAVQQKGEKFRGGKGLTQETKDMITKVAAEKGIDPQHLISMAQMESGGNQNAVSSTGAAGLFQFTGGTAKQMGLQNRFDPEQNTRAAADLYLKNKADLAARGEDTSLNNIYLAHQQGSAGAAQLLKASRGQGAINESLAKNMGVNVGAGAGGGTDAEKAQRFIAANQKALSGASATAEKITVGNDTYASSERTGGLAVGAVTTSATSIKPSFAKPSFAKSTVEQAAQVAEVKAKPTNENLKLASAATDDIPNTTEGWFDKKRQIANPTATIGIRGLPMDQVAAMNPDLDPMTGELKAKPTSKAQKMQEKADRIARWEKEHPEDIGMFPGEGQGLPIDAGAKPVMPLGERVISQPGVRVSSASAPPDVYTTRTPGASVYGNSQPAKAPTGFSLNDIGKLTSSPAVSALLSLPEMRPLMQSADIAKSAASGDFASILSNPAISGMVKNPEAMRLSGPILQSLNQTNSGVSSGTGASPVYGSSARSNVAAPVYGSAAQTGRSQSGFPSFNPVANTEFEAFDVPKGGYKTVASRSADIGQVSSRGSGMSTTVDGDWGVSTPSINSVRQEPMKRVASNVPAESQSVTVENAPPPSKGVQSSPAPAPLSNAFDTAVPKIDNIPLQISDLGLVLLNIGHI